MIRLTDEEIGAIVCKKFPLFELNEEDEEDRKETIDDLLEAQLKKVEDMGLLRHDSDAYGHCIAGCRACEALLEEVK